MILLDTDHLSVLLNKSHSLYGILTSRLLTSPDREFVSSVISLEEQLRGWLAEIRRQTQVPRQVSPYRRLSELVVFASKWRILPFDESAVSTFILLKAAKVRIGSQDMKIASIALSRQVLLLTSNSRDFDQVPNLRTENWLVPARS